VTAPELETLARRHMQRQVREVARTQAILSALWDRTLDPNDIDGSFARFQAGASELIKIQRRNGETVAQEFYDAARREAGYDGSSPAVDFQPAETRANRAALHATSVAGAKARIAKGEAPSIALELAKAAMLRSAKRRILEAPRRRIIALSERDDDARGWTRVSDGNPCSFCAMLIGRGPVYSEGTADFEAHDGCGCSAAPVFRNDKTGGWNDDSRQMRELYDASNDDASGFWRQDYDYAKKHPELSIDELRSAFAERHAAYRDAQRAPLISPDHPEPAAPAAPNVPRQERGLTSQEDTPA
jgi:hypothetical protein